MPLSFCKYIEVNNCKLCATYGEPHSKHHTTVAVDACAVFENLFCDF